MNSKEISRLEVMQKLAEKRMSQKEAGSILHLGVRQIKRLLKAYHMSVMRGFDPDFPRNLSRTLTVD